MAEGTRMAKPDDAIRQLKETSDQYQQMLNELHESSRQQKQIFTELLQKISAMDTKYDRLSKELTRDRTESSGPRSVSRQGDNPGGAIQTRTVRLDFPRFDSEDSIGWLYRAE